METESDRRQGSSGKTKRAFICPTHLTTHIMVLFLKHRGPEEFGVYRDKQIGLGHARLSIIDLKGGHQPMHNEDKTIWGICNGEILNYVELRDELIKNGHEFHTNSDSKVLVHLYEEKGPDFINDLNGQFGFAIWDSKAKQLMLARDRVGIRQLLDLLKDSIRLHLRTDVPVAAYLRGGYDSVRVIDCSN